jgi:hypothetical protein
MSNERRTLVEGLKATPPELDAKVEKQFVLSGKTAAEPAKAVPNATKPVRSPISTRIRTDFTEALKRASLERQLSGEEPNTLQDILEEAIEPWLRSKGYLQ